MLEKDKTARSPKTGLFTPYAARVNSLKAESQAPRARAFFETLKILGRKYLADVADAT